MMGHTTINKQWGLRFVLFGWISNNSQLQKPWFIADDDDTTVGWCRLARALLCFCWRRRLTAWCIVLLMTSNFENSDSIMACGTLTPVVVWRIRMADLTFF